MKYGCIGEKLGHSFSKEIHNLLADYDYELKEIESDKLELFFRKKDFIGINVTIPYKEKVIPYLDFISEQAKEIGAVNTIICKGDKLYGYNTDFSGLKALILKNKIDIDSKKVLVLGTGGTSKTASAVLKSLNAREIVVASRRKSQGVFTYDEVYRLHTDAEVILNTTPVGMYPNINETPIDLAAFNRLEGVIDVIYNPSKTKLIKSAEEKSVKACSGLYMLVYQAAIAAELFLNKTFNEETIDDVYNKISDLKKSV